MDLEHVERLIRHPSSASVSSEVLLELVAYAKELKAKLAPVDSKVSELKTAIESVVLPEVIIPDPPAAPTPPASPAAKRKGK